MKTTRPRTTKNGSNKPKKITDEAWWYEDAGGISVIHELRTNGHYIRTDTLRIPWHKLMLAAKRCGRMLP